MTTSGFYGTPLSAGLKNTGHQELIARRKRMERLHEEWERERRMKEKPPTVKNLDDHRPHVVIQTDEAVHVYPVSFFRNVADGVYAQEAVPRDVFCAIVREWLREAMRDG